VLTPSSRGSRRPRRLIIPALLAAVAATALPAPAAVSSSERAFHVVRFADRITDGSRSALAATGARILDYEPDDAYLVLADPAQARAAAGVEGVRSVAPVPVSRRLHPVLRGARGPVLVEVTARADRLAGVIADLGSSPVAVWERQDPLATAIARLSAPAARAAAAHPDVLYVAPTGLRPRLLDERTDQIQAGNLTAERTAPVTGYAEWLEGLGLSGNAEIIAVADSGIQGLHPDLQGKVVARYEYTLLPEAGDTFGHGTHVAGVAAGDPPLGTLPADLDGFAYGTGVAPGARLVDQAVGWTGSFRTEGMLGTLVRDAWHGGARIQNNSWSILTEGGNLGYVAMAGDADRLVRDADPGVPGLQPITLVFSAGNAGGNAVGIPQEAKNLIAVGATESGRLPGGFDIGEGGEIDHVADFSTRGPTSDGRVYPTVVSPGEYVAGQRSFENVYMSTGGGCLPPPQGAGLYCVASGTSFSAPHVSGATALIREWWRERLGEAPSPAMVKALLVNGATDIGERDVPNDDEGWGRVNLGSVFAGVPGVWEDQGMVLGEPDEEASWVVEADGALPLRVTLTWSDAPAAMGADPALVNDLDLVVELLDDQGQTVEVWLGNVLAEGQSVPGGTPDRLNNVENVFLPDTEAATYRVTVRAHNVPGDGIPENQDPTDQDFALIVRGAARTAAS